MPTRHFDDGGDTGTESSTDTQLYETDDSSYPGSISTEPDWYGYGLSEANTTVSYPDGSKQWTNPDGSIGYQDPDGTRYTKNPNGTFTTTFAGENYTYDPAKNGFVDASGKLIQGGVNAPVTGDNSALSKALDWMKNNASTLGKLGVGAGALYGLLNPNKGIKGTGAGWQGSIPQLVASRNMLTAPPTTMTNAAGQTVARRPGAGGINYGGDVLYSLPGSMTSKTATTDSTTDTTGTTVTKAQGGILQAARGRYLQGQTDGMADQIPSSIDGKQPAALSHGEFVVPADVVSHLGNGNSDAGAKKLYQMMDKIRMARTGTKKQGKKINPDKFMPGGLAATGYAQGGVARFDTGGTAVGTANAATSAGATGVESNLSNWAGPYVTQMLGQGQALANMPYQAYTGPLTAGPSALQEKTFSGLQGINFPGNLGQSFTSAGTPSVSPTGEVTSGAGGIAASYMNPYIQNVLQPQLAELQRQSQINLQPSLAKLTQAGGFGGGRQAIMESEAGRNLLNEQNKAIGTAYANAFDKGREQFNTEQGQAKTLADLMASQGAVQRGIESEGVAADKAQFEEARANPYKMVQFQQSLLQGLPTASQSFNTAPTNALVSAAQGATTVNQLLKNLGLTTP